MHHWPWYSQWGRLELDVISDDQFTDFLQEQISHFITDIDTGDVNDSILWETLKAFIRGHVIAYVSSKRRTEGSRLKDIEHELSLQEDFYKHNPNDATHETITNIKSEYIPSFLKELAYYLLKHNKITLSWVTSLIDSLQGSCDTRAIHKIRDRQGHLTTDPVKINKAFASFYKASLKSNLL